jgi:hypothetical protein
VGKLRRQLSPEEARALDEMIWELGWTDKQIYAEIVAEGHDVSLQGIGRHRLRMCRCSKGVQ